MRDFADDLERCAAAIGPSGVAGKFLVGHVRVVLECPGRLCDVNTRDCTAFDEFSRDFSGKPGTVHNGSEVDVVHHHFRTIVRPVSCGEEITDAQIRDCAVKEGSLVERFGYRDRPYLVTLHIVGELSGANRPPWGL